MARSRYASGMRWRGHQMLEWSTRLPRANGVSLLSHPEGHEVLPVNRYLSVLLRLMFGRASPLGDLPRRTKLSHDPVPSASRLCVTFWGYGLGRLSVRPFIVDN